MSSLLFRTSSCSNEGYSTILDQNQLNLKCTKRFSMETVLRSTFLCAILSCYVVFIVGELCEIMRFTALALV